MPRDTISLDDLGRAFVRVVASPAAVRLALRASWRADRRPRNPWRQGACLVLAKAVVGWLGADGVEVWELAGEHVLVRAGGLAIDGGGIVPIEEMLRVWAVEGGLGDRVVDGLRRSSVAEAEEKGYDLDDLASERLAAMLSEAVPRQTALAALRR